MNGDRDRDGHHPDRELVQDHDPQLWQGSPASFTGFIRQKAFCEQEVAQSVGFGCGWAQPS
jgi:hypothetical protein